MHLAWLLVLFVLVYKQLGLFILKKITVMLPIYNTSEDAKSSINRPSPNIGALHGIANEWQRRTAL